MPTIPPETSDISRQAKPVQVRPPVPWKARVRKQTAIVSRWLHIYLSMVSFAIILFFAVTGLTLNHADWFISQQRTVQRSGTMPHAWVHPESGDPAKLEIVEELRNKEKVHGAVSDFRVDDQQISLSFRAPGYTADTFIDRNSDHYELTITYNGIVAVLNDLHKGRDAGKGWGWLIDISAVLLTLVSLSGLLLLFFVYKRRTSGLILAAAGAAVCWLIWLRFVP